LPQSLPRRIGLWSAIAILVGTTIGSGIFRSPAGIANHLPSLAPFLGVWIAGGIFALAGALTVAELAGRFPETGGIYVFLREGWGPLPAFLFAWAELLILRAAALGAIAMTFAEYAVRAAGGDPSVAPFDRQAHLIAAGAIAVTGALNYRGVRWGTLLQNGLTAIKCVALLALIMVAFVHVLAVSNAAVGMVAPVVPSTGGGWAPFGLALISVLWVYDGWADVSFVAGEVERPERNLPRVLILGTGLVIAIYVLANVAYALVLPMETLRHSRLVAADVAGRIVGPAGVTTIGIVVMLSAFGTLNGSMLTGPRILWAAAHDGVLYRGFARVHHRYETPGFAIAAATVLGMIFVSIQSFEQLADTFVTAILPFYALAVAAVFPLRRRDGVGAKIPFRAIGYPVAPLLFIGATLALLINALMDPAARGPSMAIGAVILVGVPVYYRMGKWRKG